MSERGFAKLLDFVLGLPQGPLPAADVRLLFTHFGANGGMLRFGDFVEALLLQVSKSDRESCSAGNLQLLLFCLLLCLLLRRM